MNLLIHLRLIGILLIALALIHVAFPKYFNWKEDLRSMSLINRQMMKTHTFFIALIVLLMGLICLTSAVEITETKLGKRISLGLGIFWSIRLIIQFVGYSAELWKGKTFETIVHILFTSLWIYLSSVFWFISLH